MTPLLRAASVVAYTSVYSSAKFGFVLPLLRVRDDQGWYVQQVDEQTGKIAAFKTFDPESAGIERVAPPAAVSLNNFQIYAFVDEAGIQVGDKFSLGPALREFASTHPEEVATALQIYQIVGSLEERRNARLQMERTLQEQLGRRNAQAFYGSALRSTFWTKLLGAWNLGTDPARRAELKAQLRLYIDTSGHLQLENVESRNEHEREQLHSIIFELKAEFDQPGTSFPITYRSLETNYQIKPFEIRTQRQEERIAILISEILKNRRAGVEFIQNYMPRAKFERSAVEYLKRAFGHADLSEKNDEIVAAKLVNPLFTASFPFNRGYLLEYLSQHLSGFRHINHAIGQKLSETHSVYVHQHAEQIRRNLDDGFPKKANQ